jgi:hypothetical protein
MPTYRNRAWDSVVESFVRWDTVDAPDPTGVSYPETWGNASGYVVESVIATGGGGGGGGGAYNVVSTLVGTAAALNDLVLCSSAPGPLAYAVTLPVLVLANVGQEIIIKTYGQNPTVTITPGVGQLVDEAANYVLAGVNGRAHLVAVGYPGPIYGWAII